MAPAIEIVDTRMAFLGRLPKSGVCAEIGVFLGQFTAQILRQTQPKILHLVDPWRPTDYGAYQGLHPQVWNGICRGIRDTYAGDHRVKIHRETSREALGKLPNASLDWLYIDGDHRYPAVRQDLQDACRVVRRGGWICGHDLQMPGVRRAVLETLNSGRCKMRLMDLEAFTSWGMVLL